MSRYRIQLGYPRKLASGREQKTELVTAEDARVLDGFLRLLAFDSSTVAVYRPSHWTSVRRVGR